MAKLLDHEVDGIQEFDNPPPPWLVWLFYSTIVFAIGYVIVYPSTWFWQGTTRWTSGQQYENQMAQAQELYPSAPVGQMPVDGLPTDPATLELGAQVFKVRCAPCHGDNAEGKIGPNLTDDEWIYGNKPNDLVETITNGRPKGMPPWGKVLSHDEVLEVAGYVSSLGGN